MASPKARNFLVLCHLFAAALLAPIFVLVAATGFNYLIDNKGETQETALVMPADIVIDPDAADIEARVESVLAANNIEGGFEYLRMRDGSITTRPTSKDFVVLTEDAGTWTAALHQPSLQYRMMELHKGHGPEKFKIYQIVAAIALFLVVFGGLAVGIMSKAYRTKTIGAAIAGTIVFVLLAFVI